MKNKKPASQIITAIDHNDVENLSGSSLDSHDDKKHKDMLAECGINPNVFMRYKKGQQKNTIEDRILKKIKEEDGGNGDSAAANVVMFM